MGEFRVGNWKCVCGGEWFRLEATSTNGPGVCFSEGSPRITAWTGRPACVLCNKIYEMTDAGGTGRPTLTLLGEGGCSGLAARWCPIHGDCKCPTDETLHELNDPGCPLHAPNSEHAKVTVDG